MTSDTIEAPAEQKTTLLLGTSSPCVKVAVMSEDHLHYKVFGYDATENSTLKDTPDHNAAFSTDIVFEDRRTNSPAEVPTGITDDALIAILQHRLEAYGKSLAKCINNTEALMHIQLARGLLRMRGRSSVAPQ